MSDRKPYPRPDLTVIVPVFRNADTLEQLRQRLCDALQPTTGGFEVLFVDDASPDQSAATIRELAGRDERVSGLVLKENRGQHEAILVGLAFASGEVAVVMDADLQDPPEAIPTLLRALQGGVSAAFGGRRGGYESRDRLITSGAFKWLQRLLTGLPSDAGTFVAISEPLRRRLLAMKRPYASFVAMIGCAGMPTISLPIQRARRPSGHSAYTALSRLASGLRAIQWIIVWRLNGSPHGQAAFDQNCAAATASVAAFVGARFSQYASI